MEIAIVDDLQTDRDSLSNKVTEYLNHKNLPFLLTSFESAEAFLDHFIPNRFAIVFMDIYMEGMTGMEAAKEIYKRDRKCKIIFLTTSADYSLQSYSVHAVYYLIKPIQDEEFFQAMEFCELKNEYKVPFLKTLMNGEEKEIDTTQILYIDVYKRNICIHLLDGVIELKGNFSDITSPLEADNRFLICIRGLMVNMQHIARQEEEAFILNNGERLPINIRNRKSIGQTYRNYIFERMGAK